MLRPKNRSEQVNEQAHMQCKRRSQNSKHASAALGLSINFNDLRRRQHGNMSSTLPPHLIMQLIHYRFISGLYIINRLCPKLYSAGLPPKIAKSPIPKIAATFVCE